MREKFANTDKQIKSLMTIVQVLERKVEEKENHITIISDKAQSLQKLNDELTRLAQDKDKSM